ncbi:NAD-aldehyde dehydrogenase [Clavulina sp. PMI_390]|nr:NAD-aldehyde dehydrogenase [Clavulina sp. PMI_390]
MAENYTPIDEIPKIRERVFSAFATNRSRDVAFRKTQLLQMAYLLQDNLPRFEEAMKADLGRNHYETAALEMSGLFKEALIAYDKVEQWAAPEGVPFNLKTSLLKGRVVKDPQGVVLVIGPYNYPVWCLLTPLIGAIAAGCGAVIKPSEIVPHVQDLIAELIPKYLDPELYQVVTADIPGTTKLLELQWDHIMYTGNGTVGRIVATAAAKHLTPVSLELGGKSPVIVDGTADLAITARRVMWAKVCNAGQVCIAPDYVLVTDGRQEELVEAFKTAFKTLFPEGVDPSDFPHVPLTRHFDRITKQLADSKGTIVFGGKSDRSTLFIEPTLVKDVKAGDSLMLDEIFGPILPIMPVKDVQAAVDYINAHDRPLMLHNFTTSEKVKRFVEANTFSGMYAINDLFLNTTIEGLPMSGTGASGYGAHKDKAGFDSFTHRRSTFESPSWIDYVMFVRFHPFTVRPSFPLSNFSPSQS